MKTKLKSTSGTQIIKIPRGLTNKELAAIYGINLDKSKSNWKLKYEKPI